MSHDERWLGPVVRHGVEARLDDRASDERVMVSLDDEGDVRWAPVGELPGQASGRHSFHFWVHPNTDSERLDAIQILGAKLTEAGHTWEVIPVRPGGAP